MSPMEKSSLYVDVQGDSACLARCQPGDLHLASDPHGDMWCIREPSPCRRTAPPTFVSGGQYCIYFHVKRLDLFFPTKFCIALCWLTTLHAEIILLKFETSMGR